eukprot:6195711-Pleurochrysis_carterae.AAC.2
MVKTPCPEKSVRPFKHVLLLGWRRAKVRPGLEALLQQSMDCVKKATVADISSSPAGHYTVDYTL